MTEHNVISIEQPLYGIAVLLVWGASDPRTTDETALNDWWTNEHLPERLALPGFSRARRYFSKTQDGGSKYLALYEAEHLRDLRSEAYLAALNNPTARTKQFMPCLAKLNRSACEVVSSQSNTKSGQYSRSLVGNCIALVTFSRSTIGVSGEVDLGTRRLIQAAIDAVFARPGTLNVHVLREDEETTRIGSTSKSYDSVQFHAHDEETASEQRIAMIEFSLPLGRAAAELNDTLDTFRSEIEERGATGFTAETFDLVCSLDPHP
ncbi:hypothetical protein BDV96DRAFT_112805 [Lophiotrema nucula]|uniref:Uncharacterized protein n=1 Tax=Lophiotrema nucula TaxID=690887 RepID=A0A6A5Z7B3_9PLEO|nr:hypothetical protein BDV96DRAFT_112805 [Lophiotrema nucula]